MTDKKQIAKLVLEDGTVFTGLSCGVAGERYGEVVFNTSMTGYQEIITDPSYRGQIVTMTYPLIGNYGVTNVDIESRVPFFEGLVMRECSEIASNWRHEQTLRDYFIENNIVAIEGIDTRRLTKHIREQGAMKAVLSTTDRNDKRLHEKVKASLGLVGRDLVKEVTSDTIQEWNKEGKYKVVLIDCGCKYNIIRSLAHRGCTVTTVPAETPFETIRDLKPDGIMLSNGPGDPAAVTYVIDTVKALIGHYPIFGICLGHQMLGLALGGTTYKLKFGHHGGNQPVKDLRTGKIDITAQNHGFAVDVASIKKHDVEITHINCNDQTNEGLRHKTLPIFSVQYHPEAAPGPHDASYLFDDFVENMKKNKQLR
ncbi:MAG: glutamine-hydrolyzing carbamoyl-phosphate synthase small subunit [Candidatus Omnitrophica bacterium]|nr:glutamine-hydrolyzing carbamoyl-phosphate synthase small subunit [Candidatus Omnitrophota bacterium]